MCKQGNAISENYTQMTQLFTQNSYGLYTWNILFRVDPLQGNDRETKYETSAARQQILNKQIQAAVTE
jgi:hypothetical protein